MEKWFEATKFIPYNNNINLIICPASAAVLFFTLTILYFISLFGYSFTIHNISSILFEWKLCRKYWHCKLSTSVPVWEGNVKGDRSNLFTLQQHQMKYRVYIDFYCMCECDFGIQTHTIISNKYVKLLSFTLAQIHTLQVNGLVWIQTTKQTHRI